MVLFDRLSDISSRLPTSGSNVRPSRLTSVCGAMIPFYSCYRYFFEKAQQFTLYYQSSTKSLIDRSPLRQLRKRPNRARDNKFTRFVPLIHSNSLQVSRSTVWALPGRRNSGTFKLMTRSGISCYRYGNQVTTFRGCVPSGGFLCQATRTKSKG